MAPKLKHNLLHDSKIAVAVIIAGMFALGVILLAQGLINTRPYQDTIMLAVRDKTGHDLTVKGKVTLTLLPAPTIYMPGVELRDGDNPAPDITVDMVRVQVPWSSLFSGTVHISSLALAATRRSTLRVPKMPYHPLGLA